MIKKNKLASSIQTAILLGTIASTQVYAFEQGLTEQEVKKSDKQQQENMDDVDNEITDNEEIEIVEVTGSRIKANVLEGVSPVTVITSDDMIKKGFATAYDALKDLTQNTGVTQGAEIGAQGGFTPNAQTVSLRGLGSNQVLVLVNGRRVADYPAPYNGASNFVNLSSIPAAAISNIQILTSGASAIYGSDAVAGVMNIITKKDVEDTSFSAKFGTTTEGGGDEARLQLVTGTSGDDYTVTMALEYQKQDPIFSKDRDFMDSVEDGPAGHNYLDRGILIVDEMVKLGFYQDDENVDEDWTAHHGAKDEEFDESWTLYRDPGEQLCLDSGSGYEHSQRIMNLGEEDENNYGYYCGVDLSGTKTIRNERETVSVYVSSEYDLNDDTVVYADVMYAKQDAFLRGSFHYINAPIIEYRPEADGNMKALQDIGDKYAGAEYWDYRTEQRLFAEHELGFRDSNIEDQSLQINMGLQGIILDDFDWDIGFSRSENSNDKYSSLLKEEQVYNTYLGEKGDYWDVEYYDGLGSTDLYQPISAELKDALVGTQATIADSYSNTVSALITGPLLELPAGDMYFALTAEWNQQGYDIELDDRTLNKDGFGWYGVTGTEGGGDRERYAVGLELQFPITDSLNAQIAGRYDQYDDDSTDVGGRFSPQVGLEYRPTEDLLLRANWGKSFRAPDMHRVFATEGGYYSSGADISTCEDLYYNNQRDDITGELPSDVKPFDPSEHCSVQSIKGNSSGSKILKEEEGTNYGIGFVWDVSDDLNLTFDWYQIEIENLVQGESIQGILETDYYCKVRDTENEDADNYYPYPVTERPDIVPGSQQCLENSEKINREQTGFAGEMVESVSTTHVNVAKQTTEGIDAKAAYHYASSIGDWYFNIAWTHTLDSTYQVNGESDEIHTRDLWFNKTARSVVNGSFTWMAEYLSITFSGRRTGSIPIWNPPQEFGDENSHYFEKYDRLDAYYTFNLTSSYRMSDVLNVSAQVINIFNPEPPHDETHTAWPYYNSGQYGGASVGRSISAEITYEF
ncbi:TonB-dependent receptor [Thalassotalea psychrophila]|uniref:TonB-dependent receptor n=1 Tax=Thalassotalea psychrophila TaxID=3065647 RepID=A0ABY9TYA3_9GAMM|nr:TonB-dependent receptor [Colwelliaceae bacterium SQ149]